MDIYRFDDFRAFLREAFSEKKQADKKYSHRQFAREAGFKNPGFLNDVIKGFKPLSQKAAAQMAGALALSPGEKDFFLLLVRFGQAKNQEDKIEVYKEIAHRRNRSSFFRINPEISRYYQDYRYALVRGAIQVCDFRGDYNQLARFLEPPQPVQAIKKVVRDLCEWGLVKQGPDGRYAATTQMVEPEPTLLHLSRMMNAEWLNLARHSLLRLYREERHVSTMILSISAEMEREIRQRIEAFRDEVFQRVEQDQNPDRIMQLTIAFFPGSKPGRR